MHGVIKAGRKPQRPANIQVLWVGFRIKLAYCPHHQEHVAIFVLSENDYTPTAS
jgi:hypothetical protein